MDNIQQTLTNKIFQKSNPTNKVLFVCALVLCIEILQTDKDISDEEKDNLIQEEESINTCLEQQNA